MGDKSIVGGRVEEDMKGDEDEGVDFSFLLPGVGDVGGDEGGDGTGTGRKFEEVSSIVDDL